MDDFAHEFQHQSGVTVRFGNHGKWHIITIGKNESLSMKLYYSNISIKEEAIGLLIAKTR